MPQPPGPANNMGCPEISKAVIDKDQCSAKTFSSTGSAKLLPKSFKSLDEVVGLLKADESLMINIDGHTDSTGKREKICAFRQPCRCGQNVPGRKRYC